MNVDYVNVKMGCWQVFCNILYKITEHNDMKFQTRLSLSVSHNFYTILFCYISIIDAFIIKIGIKKYVIRPRIELGTFCVLSRCHDQLDHRTNLLFCKKSTSSLFLPSFLMFALLPNRVIPLPLFPLVLV